MFVSNLSSLLLLTVEKTKHMHDETHIFMEKYQKT